MGVWQWTSIERKGASGGYGTKQDDDAQDDDDDGEDVDHTCNGGGCDAGDDADDNNHAGDDVDDDGATWLQRKKVEQLR